MRSIAPTLQSWDTDQIDIFCNTYQKKANKSISNIMREKLFEKKEILGIPLILYMMLALDIVIEEESSLVDIYDQIFSLEGGIYDRCPKRKTIVAWENRHRIADIKTQIHQVSRYVSIWMFENKPEDAFIPKTIYDFICKMIFDEEISFVHRSIYEYFVAESFPKILVYI